MRWWGKYELSMNRWSHWRIGPLSLFVKPKEHAWHVAYRRYPDPQDSTVQLDTKTDSEPDPETYQYSRYAIECSDTEIELQPRLGDRSFIVSPELPLFLLAGHKSVLYVSTVVWIQASIVNGGQSVLLDLPTIRRSDTWFGENTREGELCYSTKSNARTELEDVRQRPHRAVTPVEIRNEGTGILPIEQLRVPVPALSLYADSKDQLWTDSVRFVRREGDDEATMTTPAPSTHLPGERTRLEGPRAPVEEGTIVKAFSKLLS